MTSAEIAAIFETFVVPAFDCTFVGPSGALAAPSAVASPTAAVDVLAVETPLKRLRLNLREWDPLRFPYFPSP